MKIEKGRMTVEDIMDKLVETKEGITCGCEKPQLRKTMHMDMTDCFQTNYVCDCGNQIVVVTERDPISREYWN